MWSSLFGKIVILTALFVAALFAFSLTGRGRRYAERMEARRAGMPKPERARLQQILGQLPAPAAPDLLPNAVHRDDDVVFNHRDVERLRGHLVAARFDSLEGELSARTTFARADVAGEEALYDAFDASFQPVDPRFQAMLGRWVSERPASAHALLARAYYWHGAAVQHRGTRTIGQTPREHLRLQADADSIAFSDLEAALRADPRQIAAYWLATDMSMHWSDDDVQKDVLARALTLSPLSYFSRARMLLAVRPRWGGSYRHMRSIAGEALVHADFNPALRSLPGFELMDRADVLDRRRQDDSAMIFLDSAMGMGRNYWVSQQRGELYYELLQLEEAIRDLQYAKVARPARHEPHYWLSQATYKVATRGGNWWQPFLISRDEIHHAATLDSNYRDTKRDLFRIDSLYASYRR